MTSAELPCGAGAAAAAVAGAPGVWASAGAATALSTTTEAPMTSLLRRCEVSCIRFTLPAGGSPKERFRGLFPSNGAMLAPYYSRPPYAGLVARLRRFHYRLHSVN